MTKTLLLLLLLASAALATAQHSPSSSVPLVSLANSEDDLAYEDLSLYEDLFESLEVPGKTSLGNLPILYIPKKYSLNKLDSPATNIFLAHLLNQ